MHWGKIILAIVIIFIILVIMLRIVAAIFVMFVVDKAADTIQKQQTTTDTPVKNLK